MSLAKFQPGKVLEQKQQWLFMANEVIRMGGYVEKAALDAFREGALDLRSREFMNPEAKNVIFNHRKYDSWKDLKTAKIPNYMSVMENLDEVEKEIDALLDYGMVREIKKFDEEHVVSPIHYIKTVQADGKIKARLVHHDHGCTKGFSSFIKFLTNFVKILKLPHQNRPKNLVKTPIVLKFSTVFSFLPQNKMSIFGPFGLKSPHQIPAW